MIYYLKSDSPQELTLALVNAGVINMHLPHLTVSPRFLVDYIGQMSTSTGEVDEEGQVILQLTEEYFLNLKVLHPESSEYASDETVWLSPEALSVLSEYVIPEPQTPYRVWAT
ncbi:MAG: hypothetical protein CMB99_00620 [Flavobacteriaceae bacterium]|jgi:hypothetical protein|nr:hypothetical protein [Flavobacteriaceae bacterium]|tara:strand:+ start:2943 stop:3281 length:339 start_codon:yes stop_codon:yes gene_type:complete